MKLLKKMILIVLIATIFMIVIQNFNISLAATTVQDQVTTLLDSSGNDEVNNATKNIAGTVITVTKTACAGIAIMMLSVIAAKYILAAPAERADIKKSAVPYLIGAIIMFSTTGVLNIIQSFTTSALGS